MLTTTDGLTGARSGLTPSGGDLDWILLGCNLETPDSNADKDRLFGINCTTLLRHKFKFCLGLKDIGQNKYRAL